MSAAQSTAVSLDEEDHAVETKETSKSKAPRVPALSPVFYDNGDAKYPLELSTSPSDRSYSEADIPALRTAHGRDMVLIGRLHSTLVARAVSVSMIKFGVIGRSIKIVDRTTLLEELQRNEWIAFEELSRVVRPRGAAILVCCPPISAHQAFALAEAVAEEESLFVKAAERISALDAVSAGKEANDIVRNHVDTLIRCCDQARSQFLSRINEAVPPVGEWNVYTAEGKMVDPDKLARAIKGFASQSARVHPPLPEVNHDDAAALRQIYDYLIHSEDYIELGAALLNAAIRSPLFVKTITEAADTFGFVGRYRPRVDSAAPDSHTDAIHSDAEVDAELEEKKVPYMAAVFGLDTITEDNQTFAQFERIIRQALAGTAHLVKDDRHVPALIKAKTEINLLPVRQRIEVVDMLHSVADSQRARMGIKSAKANQVWIRLVRELSYHFLQPKPDEYPMTGKAFTAEASVMALHLLYSEELTTAARRDTDRKLPINASLPFVLDLESVLALDLRHAVDDVKEATARLDQYVGGYLADLDLTQSFITGSAMAAALIKTDHEQSSSTTHNPVMDYEAYLACYYPTIYTEPVDDEDYQLNFAPALHGLYDDHSKVSVELLNETEAVVRYYKRRQVLASLAGPLSSDAPEIHADAMATAHRFVSELKGEEKGTECLEARFMVRSGADVDIAIDVKTNEEFDEVARRHYEVIRQRHSHAILNKVQGRKTPTQDVYVWQVSTSSLEHIPSFRTVEMYRANFGHIVTHHVGMVRGAYTSAFGSSAPKFYVTASFVLSMHDLSSPNYYYFASRKYQPQEVLLKYTERGFTTKNFPAGLNKAISIYARHNPKWYHFSDGYLNYPLPALHAAGNFSVFSLLREMALNAATCGYRIHGNYYYTNLHRLPNQAVVVEHDDNEVDDHDNEVDE